MSHTPAKSVRLAVELAKVAVVGALAVVALTPAVTTTQGAALEGTTGTQHEVPSVDRGRLVLGQGAYSLQKMMARLDCSATGFGPDVVPTSALVRRAHHVRHVSFDDGWDSYTGDAGGTLLAVCRSAVGTPSGESPT